MHSLLSIQSFVSYGHVGNSSVVFPLQRLGFQIWPINTVNFSNHTGYGYWQGSSVEPQIIRNIFLGLKQLGVLPNCNALLTGYMGTAELGEVMLEILAELQTLNPQLIYCCDPVFGDVGRGIFVKPGIPEFFQQRLTPKASIITPNMFELEYLSSTIIHNVEDALRACEHIFTQGIPMVLATSLQFEQDKASSIYMLAATKDAAYLIKTPLLPLAVNGAGDLTAALFTAFYLTTQDLEKALEACTDRIFGILTKTHQHQQRELQLVLAQDELIKPSLNFTANRLR